MSRLYRIADDLIEASVNTPSQAHALADAIRQLGFAEEVVPALKVVTIKFDPIAQPTPEIILDELDFDDLASAPEIEPALIIPIIYGGDDGIDFNEVCHSLELTPVELIRMHSEATHHVDMIGFTPGFTYLSGLPDALNLPRLKTPRTRVKAGSVGISGGRTGIYALDGPGGWPIIGRTGFKLFDPSETPPFRLRPGQSVRFEAINAEN